MLYSIFPSILTLIILAFRLHGAIPAPTSNLYVTMCSQGNQLGGQLLGYAVVLGYAWTHGFQPYFPPERLLNIVGGELNYRHIFNRLPQTLCSNTNMSPPIHTTHQGSGYPIPNYGRNLCICYEPALPLNYFHKFRSQIRELFAPSQEIIEEAHRKYPFIFNHPKTVAIHVRVYHPSTVPHRCLGKDYFIQAINRFSDDHLFLIFSDRINWCKDNLDLKNKNVIFIEGNNHLVDFYLMSFCKNIIISNSTYSWWAAYLKKDAEGLILAPERWFNIETAEQRKTFYPENYMPIPVSIPENPDWSILNYQSNSLGDT